MKKLLFSLIFVLVILPLQPHSENKVDELPPCSAILEPTKNIPKNARGVALIYTIERKFNDERTSLSVHALHLPKPSSFGDYDGYEVLAYIPEEITWTFSLSPITNYGETTWVGNLDEISPTMRPTRIKVRTINTVTKKTGPIVLEKIVKPC
ncbi:hypothetical protein CSV79_08360 [Sporosarcina sp. P13]|uniref:hypothetical protein n=1 Tax=Sporosarcina sp. P13 TaxID=2048263 RepID=UPI000C171CCA|nr:hypothetical protein [Sporosarcina sp. P13]PIC64061.1 hypothetical protein CSV79_08360 [Sporosarcina sp. P13]